MTVALLNIQILLLFVMVPHDVNGAVLGTLGDIKPCIAPCTDYGILITPRGKTNTFKLSVYKFSLKKGAILKPSDVKKLKTDPNEMAYDPEKLFRLQNNASITEYILPLVRSAEEAIPKEQHTSTPIFFSIPSKIKDENPSRWYRVLSDLSGIFSNNKTIPFMIGSLSVIPNKPEVEALYKWKTVNFLLGNLEGKEESSTVAVLSSGGDIYSDISFEQRDVDGHVSDVVTIKGVPHPVATSTFINGPESVNLKRYFDAISIPMKKVMKSPCGPRGLKKKFKGKPDVHWIVGTGDIDECRSIIRKAILSKCGKLNGCPFLDTRFKGEFYAFPNVGEIAQSLGCQDCGKVLTPAKLDASTRRACGSGKEIPAKSDEFDRARNANRFPSNSDEYDRAQNESNGGENDPHGVIECLDANYLYVVMTEAYHMDKNQNIFVRKEIGGKELDPGLGELLTQMKLL